MFNEAECQVYGPYFNGESSVHGDPFRIHRTLIHLLRGDPNGVLKSYRSDNEEERFAATNELVAAAVEAFRLVPFDPKTGQGCTEKDALKVVQDYLAWCDKKKASSESTPIGSPATDGRPEVLGAPKNAPVAEPAPAPAPPTRSASLAESISRVGLPST